jgi:pyruvate/2-oxoacid:ferredoxin oxidoreductase beta subunit
VTTTTPGGKPTFRKDFMQIVAAHRIPYAATCSIAHVEDMKHKVERAMTCGGTAYLHILAPCPTGWFYDSELSIELARLAVQSLVWPLYEIVDGIEYRITQKISRPRPVSDYMKPQGRFSKVTEEEMSFFQQRVDKDYALLLKRAQA